MADVFIECMVRRKPDAACWMRRATLWLSQGLLILAALGAIPLIPEMAFLILPAACLGVWGLRILGRRLNVEYEYIFTNGDVDFDVIYGRTRRKRLLSADCRNFEIMAPVKEDYRRELESQNIAKRWDFSSSMRAERQYFAIFNDKTGKRTLVVFEPSDRMRDAMKTYLRNKFRD